MLLCCRNTKIIYWIRYLSVNYAVLTQYLNSIVKDHFMYNSLPLPISMTPLHPPDNAYGCLLNEQVMFINLACFSCVLVAAKTAATT